MITADRPEMLKTRKSSTSADQATRSWNLGWLSIVALSSPSRVYLRSRLIVSNTV